jgi:hypothetical protein
MSFKFKNRDTLSSWSCQSSLALADGFLECVGLVQCIIYLCGAESDIRRIEHSVTRVEVTEYFRPHLEFPGGLTVRSA